MTNKGNCIVVDSMDHGLWTTLVMTQQSEILLNIDQSSGKGRYVSSNHSFLFSLHAPTGPNVRKFNIKKKLFAVSHHPNCGPIFGAGELVAFDWN